MLFSSFKSSPSLISTLFKCTSGGITSSPGGITWMDGFLTVKLQPVNRRGSFRGELCNNYRERKRQRHFSYFNDDDGRWRWRWWWWWWGIRLNDIIWGRHFHWSIIKITRVILVLGNNQTWQVSGWYMNSPIFKTTSINVCLRIRCTKVTIISSNSNGSLSSCPRRPLHPRRYNIQLLAQSLVQLLHSPLNLLHQSKYYLSSTKKFTGTTAADMMMSLLGKR